jgi:hypothetical protein
MGVLKDGRFWAGVVVGYLLLMFMPQLSIRSRVKAGA